MVFPSGGTDPVYISDWEWMLKIFKKAIEEQGIEDGYCMSLYYPGYLSSGDLVSAFGGGSTWYKTANNTIEYGMTSDNFRTYLQCMNQWYKNGWIDKAFPEHSSDMFYKIDDVRVRQGKIGLWMGIQAQLIGKGDSGEGFANGMVAYAARQPMNDIYGTDAQKNKEPYVFYQQGLESQNFVITDKAAKKDIVALCSFLDYLYSDEGMLLREMGLSKEQYEVTKNELYTKFGLTEGAYTVTKNEEGINEVELVDKLKADGMLWNAARSNRFYGIKGVPEGYKVVNKTESETLRHSYNEWIAYSSTGSFTNSFISQLPSDEAALCSKTNTNLDEFCAKTVPGFIQGEKDPYNDSDWNAYVKALNKYGPDKVTNDYQKLLDQLK